MARTAGSSADLGLHREAAPRTDPREPGLVHRLGHTVTAHRALARGLGALALAALSLIWVAPAGAGTALVPTWSTLSPPQSPPGLQYASEAYDADDQTVVLFGGLEADGSVSGATWIWNGTTWTQAATQFLGPPPRQGAAMAYNPNSEQLILFGGEGADGSFLNDTWAWNGQSWFQEPTTPSISIPPAREGASLAYDAKNGDLVLFGGTGTSVGAASAASTGSSPTTDPTTTTTAPTTTIAPPTTEPPTTLAPSTLSPSTDAGASDPSTTSDPSATDQPTATDATTPLAPATDSATTTDPTTTDPTTTDPTNPDAVSSTVIDAAVASNPTTFNDTWEWNGAAWSQLDQSNPPPARTDATLSWDPSLNETILFGGSATPIAGGGATPLGDTWAWNGQDWSQLSPASAPAARYDALSTAAVGLSDDIVAGGVGNNGVADDIWTFNGSTWTSLTTDGTLAARSGAAAAWDDSAGQLVVFGGAGASGNTLADTVVLTEAAPVTVVPTSGSSSATSTPTNPSTAPTTPAATTSPTSAGNTTSEPGSLSPGTTPPDDSTTLPVSSSSVKDTTTNSTTTTVPATAPSTAGVRLTSPGSETTPVAEAKPATSPTAASPSTGTVVAPVQTVHTGSLVTVLGSGFRPGTVVTITFHSKPYTVGRTIAGPTGTFSATVTVPATASLGEHHIEAAGLSPRGTLNVLLTPLKVVPLSSNSSSSPSHTTLIMVGVAVLLPIGTWIFLSLRSRRHPSAAQ
jgi:hypothetical protein